MALRWLFVVARNLVPLAGVLVLGGSASELPLADLARRERFGLLFVR